MAYVDDQVDDAEHDQEETAHELEAQSVDGQREERRSAERLKQLQAELPERIKQLQAQKADLLTIKQQVETFEAQKKILTQRVQTIEQLQRDRTGAQELLDEIASTVSRTENLC